MIIKIPYLRIRVANTLSVIYGLIALSPLWALLGIRYVLVPVSIVVLAVILHTQSRYRSCRIPIEGLPLVGILAFLFFSMLLNLDNVPTERLLSSINTFIVWLSAIMLFIIGVDSEQSSIRRFAYLLVSLGLVNATIAAIGLVLWFNGLTRFVVVAPIAEVFGLRELAATSRIELVGAEYFAGRQVPRTSSYTLFPTALGALTMFSLFATVYLAWTERRMRIGPAIFVVVLLPFIMSFARMAWLSFAIGGLVSLLLLRAAYLARDRLLRTVIVVLSVALYVVVAAMVIGLTISSDRTGEPDRVLGLRNPLSWVLSAREGSTSSRGELYQATITQTVQNFPFGVGHKPFDERFGVAVGSHSTVLGLLLRGGVPVAIMGLVFVGLLVWRLLSRLTCGTRQSRQDIAFLSACLIGSLFWMITDDIDVTHEVAFAFFLAAALICGVRMLPESSSSERLP